MRRDIGKKRLAERKVKKEAPLTLIVVLLVLLASASVFYTFRAEITPLVTAQTERVKNWWDARKAKKPLVAKVVKKSAPPIDTSPPPIHFEFYSTLPETRLHPSLDEKPTSMTTAENKMVAPIIRPVDIDQELKKQTLRAKESKQ